MAQAKKTKRVRKKKFVCVWCKGRFALDKGKRIPAHQSRQSREHWPYPNVDPSRCPGSGVDPKDWIPRPVPTHPQAKPNKKKRVKRKVKA